MPPASRPSALRRRTPMKGSEPKQHVPRRRCHSPSYVYICDRPGAAGPSSPSPSPHSVFPLRFQPGPPSFLLSSVLRPPSASVTDRDRGSNHYVLVRVSVTGREGRREGGEEERTASRASEAGGAEADSLKKRWCETRGTFGARKREGRLARGRTWERNHIALST